MAGLAAPLSARSVGRLGTRSTMLVGYAFLLLGAVLASGSGVL